MKVLFLDIDGVLNSHGFLESIRETEERIFAGGGSIEWWSAMLDPEAVMRLWRVLNTTGAKVCVSSSWRLGMPYEQLVEIFRRHAVEVVGATPEHKSMNSSRGKEIAHWLRGSPGVNVYAIVDDYIDAGDGHGDRFVQTSYSTGLRDEHVDELIRILGRKS